MVIIPGFLAFTYHTGLDRIRDAFLASITTMQEAQRQASEAHAQYLDSGKDDSQYDEDGVLVSSTRHSLEWKDLQASLSITVVREAYITSAFHYWERSARQWTKNHNARFAKLRQLVLGLGYPVSDELETLNALNNLLKHDNPRRGHELLDLKSSLLRGGRAPIHGDWQSALVITNDDVTHFIEVVRASGPQFGT